MKITVETTVQAPIDKVWSAYTTPQDIVQWNTASPDLHTTKASVLDNFKKHTEGQ